MVQWTPRKWSPPKKAYVRQHFDGVKWVAAYEDNLWVRMYVEADTEQGAKDKLLEALEKALRDVREAFLA